MIGIFTFGYAVVMGGFLCLTSTLVCDVSLWGDLCVILFYLKTSATSLMDCILAYLMDINGDVGSGLEMVSIRYNSILVADS